ncbi:prolipoprotein diacylglyceryl transferase [Marinomonas ushuaiensis DSM 15871]|uniref:Phosphatidylglycerol--prolipoprotein diacylglyceryl transferase n=1 Tax=Marinomonas ushuaiensis DSM 15871 TaxID=1122207 RepID=X7E265_9GAMM|nr:prolipoprotein diacylglyceryl transferase [Marinomonas ushuaiensis]ETX10169.1 prolipoprotein diacylglyceryl transferase [Marinomonas ushuaiensis DSM 15871]
MISYPAVDPIAISIGPISVHWYGIMYLIGFASAYVLGMYRAKRSNGLWAPDMVSDAIFYGALGVILGGRIGYILFYQFPAFVDNPLVMVRIWEGGMSFHGGLLGVIAAMYFFARRYNKHLVDVTDFLAPFIPIGLGAGRIGNFIGSELWGKPSDVSWAMVFPNDPLQLARHPSQLYQFALEGVALFCILWLFSQKSKPRYCVSGMFLLFYGLFRILVEFVREPDAQIGYLAFNWVTQGQVLSLPMVVGGIALIIAGFKFKKFPQN